jgi:signal transduction histidine kinase
MERVKRVLNDKIKESDCTIISDFSVQTYYAIPAYIDSIFYNLISNAIKYRSLERNPEISITTLIENDSLVLLVKDNGLGMDTKKLKDKIFTLYQRFHHHVEGKGIGLFLVKTQVEALNGTIEISSKVNEGTTFTIRLPLKQGN